MSINTDIVREPPSGTYVRISSRSGSAFTHNVHVIDGVIDPDYRSNIKIGLINQSDTPYVVSKGNRITQFILEKSHYPSINIVDHLTPTTRDTHGFGGIEQRTFARPTTQGHTGQYITPHVQFTTNHDKPDNTLIISLRTIPMMDHFHTNLLIWIMTPLTLRLT